MSDLEHDPGRQQIIEVLQRHEVQFIVIGGAASQSRGWDGQTADVDVTPSRAMDNLTRLAAALTELDACFRVDEERYPHGFPPPGGLDAYSFRSQVSVALTTEHGHLDVCLIPDGFPGGYEDLLPRAEVVPVAQTTRSANVADAGDILLSKETADRQKDRDMLPALRAAFEKAGTLKPRPGPAVIAARDIAAARQPLPPRPGSGPTAPSPCPGTPGPQAARRDHDVDR